MIDGRREGGQATDPAQGEPRAAHRLVEEQQMLAGLGGHMRADNKDPKWQARGQARTCLGAVGTIVP